MRILRIAGEGLASLVQPFSIDLTAEPRNGIWSWVVVDRDGSLQIASSHNTATLPVPRDHPLGDPPLR